MAKISDDIRPDIATYREFYIIREFHSLAIIAYGWTEKEAWHRAGDIHNSPKPDGPQCFLTTILVDRPEGW